MRTRHIERRDRYASVTMSEEELMRRKRADQPIWQMVEELLKEIPAEDLARMPSDGAEQHDHYIYGTPKRTNEDILADTSYWVALIDVNDQWHERATAISKSLYLNAAYES